MKALRSCSALVLLTAVAVPVLGQGTTVIGQDSSNRVITTAVPFLTITPDARASGMGETGVATSADANAPYWNIAKLVFSEKDYGFAISYTPWLSKIINDMSVSYLSGYYKITREQAVAMSMKYFDLGEIQFNKGPNPADQLGTFNPREFALDVAYSRMLIEQKLSIGGALRYIHSNLTGALTGSSGSDARPGNTVAVDVGIYYTKPSRSNNSELALAAIITNMGGKISYNDQFTKDFIPTNLRMGGSYKFFLDPTNTMTFALDFNKLMVPSPLSGRDSVGVLSGWFGSFTDAPGGFEEEMQEIMISSGVEYWYNDLFAARIGYFYENPNKGNRQLFTGGVGFRYQKFGIDIAYQVPTNKKENPLAEAVRFSLFMNFEKTVREQDSVTD
jgi:hypothetical protein